MKPAQQPGAALVVMAFSSAIASMGCIDEQHAIEATASGLREETTFAEGELLACKYETCAHPKCAEGMPIINSSCDPCVKKVCDAEPICCGLEWGQLCVDLVGQLCNNACANAYSIKVKSSGKCLYLPSPGIFSGTYLAACSGASEQAFSLAHRGGGTYDLVPATSGLCLGADPWAHSNMEPQILQIDCFDSGNIYVVALGGGYYYLLDRYTGFCYEAVEVGNQLAALHESACDGGDNQKFRFVY